MGRSENWVKNNWKRVLKREKIPSSDKLIKEKVEGVIQKLTLLLESEINIEEGDKKGSNSSLMMDVPPSSGRCDGEEEKMKYAPSNEEVKDTDRNLWPSSSLEEYKAEDLMSLSSGKLSKPPTFNSFNSDSNMHIEFMEKTGVTGETIYPSNDYNGQ
eukprot:TRINITY_DN2059_c0_g1_i1.p2 TRINITY_DN2059_c0_g1~~TRINITY_DN2059_c0_g1_i1.p2  ORF type:complete len:157 (+),score=40.23 TRINITY_DN2059_c0_g1_i1:1007-1477(+)